MLSGCWPGGGLLADWNTAREIAFSLLVIGKINLFIRTTSPMS